MQDGISPSYLRTDCGRASFLNGPRLRVRLREGALRWLSQKTENSSTLPPFCVALAWDRKIVQLKSKQAFFSQGSPADSIFYLQTGRAKITVVSKNGKEATIALLSAGDFVGEESLATVGGLHMATMLHCHQRLRSTKDREGRRWSA